MRHMTVLIALVAAMSLAAPARSAAAQDDAQRRQPRTEQPRTERPQAAQPRPNAEPPQEPSPRTEGEGQPAQPRQPADGQRRAQPRPTPRARTRPAPPPPHVPPPNYYAVPRHYAFPPVSLRLGFYYHPYFGFYYGPYYGPFYPYPGPYYRAVPFTSSALRLRVKPVETEVYLNGYYAGVVDDFDGVFQRLYVPAGHLDLELRLDGYESFHQKIYVAAGNTLDITHQMQPLRAGDANPPLPEPGALPPEWTMVTPPPIGDEPASPYGILAVSVAPADAQIFVDDEAWLGMEGRAELAIHLPAGWHRLEVRKAGYQTFSTQIELTEGNTTRLNVKLVQ
jgi:PEGA domain